MKRISNTIVWDDQTVLFPRFLYRSAHVYVRSDYLVLLSDYYRPRFYIVCSENSEHLAHLASCKLDEMKFARKSSYAEHTDKIHEQ